VPGGGALFYFDLPTWDVRLSQTDAQPGGTPILVCEDEPDAAEILCAHLRESGFAPDVAGTAGGAERAAAGKLYAAILVDLRLPDGDGITLIQRLRAQWRCRNTLIVVVSATPEIGAQDARAASLRVLEWMRKPVDFDRLNRLLR
jgi:DNA-binding response OmpR family regulator